MLQERIVDVSIIMPYGDDEDVVGAAVKRLYAHLDAAELECEILAVDEDSGDNSHALLALVQREEPGLKHRLRILHGGGRGRGYAHAARHASGRVLWLIEPRATLTQLQPFIQAYRQIVRGERDVFLIDHRSIALHRTRSGAVVTTMRGRGDRAFHKLIQRARMAGLAVESGGYDSGSDTGRRHGPLNRLLHALGLSAS